MITLDVISGNGCHGHTLVLQARPTEACIRRLASAGHYQAEPALRAHDGTLFSFFLVEQELTTLPLPGPCRMSLSEGLPLHRKHC